MGTFTSDSKGNVFEVRVVPAGTEMPSDWHKRYAYQDYRRQSVEVWYREASTKLAPIRLDTSWHTDAASQQDAS